MSGDKEKLEQLVGKIDELLAILKDVSDDLKTTSASIKSLAVSQITTRAVKSEPQRISVPISRSTSASGATKSSIPVSDAPSVKSQNLEDIRMMFPQDLDSMLAFEDKGDFIMIKPKQFLGSENFAKIASTVRGIGGEYISAGRDSHFRVYKKNVQ